MTYSESQIIVCGKNNIALLFGYTKSLLNLISVNLTIFIIFNQNADKS